MSLCWVLAIVPDFCAFLQFCVSLILVPQALSIQPVLNTCPHQVELQQFVFFLVYSFYSLLHNFCFLS